MFEVSKETKEIGQIITIYGSGGCHKSTILGEAVLDGGDSAVLISVGENGIDPLKGDKVVRSLAGVNHLTKVIDTWCSYVPYEEKGSKIVPNEKKKTTEGMMELLKWLYMEDTYDVIAFDSLTDIREALYDYCFNEYFLKGSTKTVKQQHDHATGFDNAGILPFIDKEWNKFLKALKKLREKGKTIYIGCHEANKKVKLPTGELPFDAVGLNMFSNKSYDPAKSLYNTSDLFLYAKRNIEVASERGKGVGIGGDEVVLVSKESATIAAKRRVDMPDEIPAVYSELKQYL